MLSGVKHTRAYQAIASLSVAGILIASYGTYIHFARTPSVCDINARFNCDTVNRGPYAEIFGVPIALIGVIGYALMFLISYEMIARPRRAMKLLFAAHIGIAAAFSAHLAWVSDVIIGSWCLSCIASYLVTFLILCIFLRAEI